MVSDFDVELFVSGVVVSRSGLLRLSLDPKPSNHQMVFRRVNATLSIGHRVGQSVRPSVTLVFCLIFFSYFAFV